MRECLALLQLAKTAAHRVRVLNADLANLVSNVLPPLSQLLIKVEKAVKHG